MKRGHIKNRGQITFGIAALLTTGSMVASVLTAYFTAQLSTQEKISDVQLASSKEIAIVNSAVSVVSTREDNTEKRMDRFESKLDALLEKNNINPAAINARFPDQQVLASSTMSLN